MEAEASTAPALAPVTTLLANLQVACANSGWPQAGQLPRMQAATGDCMRVARLEHPPEQKAGVHCATPAADPEATVHLLLPDEKPAMSMRNIDVELLLCTEASSMMPNGAVFSFLPCTQLARFLE